MLVLIEIILVLVLELVLGPHPHSTDSKKRGMKIQGVIIKERRGEEKRGEGRRREERGGEERIGWNRKKGKEGKWTELAIITIESWAVSMSRRINTWMDG